MVRGAVGYQKIKGEFRRLLNDPALFITIVSISLLLLIFIALPLFKIFQGALYSQGQLSLRYFKEFLQKSYQRESLYHSLIVGALVASIGTIIGFIFAYAVTRTDIPFKRFFRIVATFPIISPPFLLALAMILLLGRHGLLTELFRFKWDIYGLPGLVITETLAYFPIAFMTLEGVLQRIDPAMEEAALDLGASKLRVFFTVTLPLATPGIASALLLVFIRSLEDFGNPIVIQGNYRVLTVQAYLAITGMYNMPLGATLSLFLLMPTIGAFIFQRYWVSRKSYVTVTGKQSGGGLRSTEKSVKYPLLIALILLTLFILCSYGSVLYGSFTKLWAVDNSLTLENYRYVFSTGWGYLKDTLFIASIATPIAGLLAMLIAYLVTRKEFIGKSALDFISMLNFAVPGTVVGIGYILAFNSPPFRLTGTAAIIVLVFIFRRMPVGIRNAVAELQQIDPSIEEASSDLGSGLFRTFGKVVLPLVSSAFLSGLVYVFVRCMTAISAVIFVVSGDWQLLTVALLGEVDNAALSHAAAYGCVIIAIVLIAIGMMRLLVGRFIKGRQFSF
ncbi:MAG: iron ABC transporter permease [Candidatus Aerophobus sp.]|nr:MAG: iron ABC transporter permease [Candidatus Aerophobus sp.]